MKTPSTYTPSKVLRFPGSSYTPPTTTTPAKAAPRTKARAGRKPAQTVYDLLPNAGTSLGFKVTGHSINDGIEDGDVLIVDTSRSVTRECIAVATINGQHTIKRFRPDGNRLYIISDRSAPREAPHDCEIFGVATHIFRALPD